MITEVENIILNKEYFELTPEELESVSELVQNAEDYDEMKWFLASTNEALVSEQIEATPELKEKVMAHLHQDERQRKFWLNGVVVFLWPTDKEFYRRPAFQMSLAAILLIGFLFVYNRNVNPEATMAVNDTEQYEKEGEVSSEDDFTVVDETTIGEETEIPSVEEITAFEEPIGGSNNGGGMGGPNDINLLEDELASPNQPTVTDADGYYGLDFEMADEASEIDEEVEEDANLNNVSNANNNERPNKVLLESRLEKKEDKDSDYRRNDNTDLSKNDRGGADREKKNRDKDKGKNNKKYKMSSKEQVTSDSFDADDIVDENQQNNPGSPDNSNNGNSNSTEDLKTEQDPNLGIYNTVTLDGVTNTGTMNDIIPYQQTIKQTKELRKLFATFK